jgi:hypothetical protein
MRSAEAIYSRVYLSVPLLVISHPFLVAQDNGTVATGNPERQNARRDITAESKELGNEEK